LHGRGVVDVCDDMSDMSRMYKMCRLDSSLLMFVPQRPPRGIFLLSGGGERRKNEEKCDQDLCGNK